MVSSRAMFSIVSLASLVLLSILAPSMLSKSVASILLRFSYELLGSDSIGRRGVSTLCTLAKSKNGRVVSLLTSS